MFSQDGKRRSTPLVYGKVRRAQPTYNVFDLDDALGGGTQSRSCTKQDEPHLGQQQIQGQVIKSIEITPKGKLSKIRSDVRSRRERISTDPFEQTESGPKDDRDQRTSAFDLPPSDEEDRATLFERSMQKRRRLTPVKCSGSNVKPLQRGLSRSDTSQNSNELSRTSRAATKLQNQTKKQPEPKVAQQSPRRSSALVAEENHQPPQALHHATPKQPKLLSTFLNSSGRVDSPSKLALTSLSLTNGQDSESNPVEPSSVLLNQTRQVQKRGLKPKRRLIDAMISPQKPRSVSVSSESSSDDSALHAPTPLCATEDVSEEVELVPVAVMKDINETPKTIESVPNSSSISSNASSKPRVTYSRERSHLADMMTDDWLEPISQSSSQQGNLVVTQNNTIFSSFGSAISHEGSEEDLEQETTGIRSIHELRHLGGNVRSHVDLESILEDIEAEGLSARSRRLRGLAQLIEKLGDPEIGRYISDQSLDRRLLRFPYSGGDVLEQTLLTMALSRLIASTQLPLASLRRAFETLVQSATDLLQERRGLANVVRDRKQNLSKMTCKEITALVEPFCSSMVWPDRRPKLLSPQLVLIRSLDLVLRQVRQLGDFGMVLPASILSQLVELLRRLAPTQLIDGKEEDSVLVMKFTISAIESLTISKSWSEEGCLDVAKRLCGLGPILDHLCLSSAESSDRTHHLILRLILNITNNDPDLCDAFSEPALVSAIFGIIKRDFMQTTMLTNAVLGESNLEGVILALGALSNLAEHSSLFRQAMLDNSLDGRIMIEWIAITFRDQLEVASEASTVEQTASLVAFGYLSVLLCNVCMDTGIRHSVRKILKGGTLRTLLLFVQEFLDHFRRAENLELKQVDAEGQTESGFAERFEGVLDALRQAEESC